MTTTLNTQAEEEGTFVITADFTDEEGAAVVPNSGLKWHLTNDKGKIVINSRSDQAISSASSVSIVLSGDDLAFLNDRNDTEGRVLTIEGTYDGSLGVDLPLVAECIFTVYNMKKIPSS